jgi:hypothetical protein
MDVTSSLPATSASGRVLITHAEMGIYLGSCMGLAFWSKLDPVGQPSAVTFPSAEAAREHMTRWELETPWKSCSIPSTPRTASTHQSPRAVAAGLDGWVDETTPVANERPL